MVGSHVAEAVQVAGSFMAVLSFGIVLDLPKKYLGWSGVTGGGLLAGVSFDQRGNGIPDLCRIFVRPVCCIAGAYPGQDTQSACVCFPDPGNPAPGSGNLYL